MEQSQAPITYPSYINKVIDEHFSKTKEFLEKYRVRSSVPSKIDEVVSEAEKIDKVLEKIQKVILPEPTYDVNQFIKDKYSKEINSYNEEIRDLENIKVREIKEIYMKKESRINEKKLEIEKKKAEYEASYIDIKNRHLRLIEKREDIIKILSLYNLPDNSLKIETSSMELKEIDEMITMSEQAFGITVGNSKITDKLVSLLYLPVIKSFGDELLDNIFKVSYLIFFLILSILGSPYFMSVIGIMYIIKIFGNMVTVNKNKELLYLSIAMMEPIDFSRFIDVSDLLCELEDIESIDLSEEENEVIKKYDKMISDKKFSNPSLKMNTEKMHYIANIEEYNQKFSTVRSRLEDVKREIEIYLKYCLKLLEGEIDTFKSKCKPLGSSISSSRVLNDKFKVASINYKNEVIGEFSTKTPIDNILFRYKEDNQRADLINYMKLLLCNAICNIKEKYLNVTIYDYKFLGKDFSEFLDPKVSEYIKLENTGLQKIIDNLIEVSKINIGDLSDKTIQEFNSESEKIGKMTKAYNLLIVVSSDVELAKNEMFRNYLDYSAQSGVIIWYLEKDSSLIEENSRKDYIKFFEGRNICEEYGQIDYKEYDTRINYNYPITKYKYNNKIGRNTVESLIKSIETNKIVSIPQSKFNETYIPKEKMWTYDSTYGLEINLGFKDGDPSKGESIILNDNPAHVLEVGVSGAGKSVAINSTLSVLCMKYSPENLELVMVDFKAVEFGLYANEYVLPHASVISGTKDGEYALSIFSYLLERMREREALFQANGVKNIVSYNELMVARGTPHKKLPRMIGLIDEFQVPFNELDSATIEKLKVIITSLAKLARFCGCHLWFTSQSMKGTVSADILDQFPLRIVLRASVDLSNEILGNPASSTIREMGWLYSNSVRAQDNARFNNLWRIPYPSEDYIKDYLKMMNEKCAKERFLNRNAKFYIDSKVHPAEELKSILEIKEIKEDSNCILLGEPTVYSENKIIPNFIFGKDSGENVIVAASERKNSLDIANTFIENIQSKQGAILRVHCPDSDSRILMDLENRFNKDEEKAWLAKDLDLGTIIEAINYEIETREKDRELDKTPLYIVCIGWDKMEGIGRNKEARGSRYEDFVHLIQKCSERNIRFIIFVKDAKGIKSLVDQCNHRICSFVDEITSSTLLDSPKAYKMADTLKKPMAIYKYGNEMIKYKIYNYELKGVLPKRSVFIK